MEGQAVITYENIPFKAFYHCLYDESLIDSYGIDKDHWKEIKTKWQKANPVESEEFEGAKQLFSKTALVNKLKACLHRYIIWPGGCEELFKEVGVPWTEDPAEYLQKQIQKESKICEILAAKLKKSTKDAVQPEFSMTKLNEAIASLEPHGFNIPDYNTLTLSKYEAITKIIERNGRRQNNG